MKEHVLIKKAKKGDVEAFGELYTTVYKKLYRFALYILKNPQDAEDVVSEAVTDAFNGVIIRRTHDHRIAFILRI